MSSSSVRLLCDLHVHLDACGRPRASLHHLASCEVIPNRDWYECAFEAVYGFVPPARELVEELSRLSVVSDADAGNLAWVTTDHCSERFEQVVLGFVETTRADLVAQGMAHAEQRTFSTGPRPLLEALARTSEVLVTDVTRRGDLYHHLTGTAWRSRAEVLSGRTAE